MTTRWPRILLVTLCCLLAVATSASADTKAERESLRGLGGVRVLVETIVDPNDGLSAYTIQTDVELRLRQAGIRVLSESEWANEVQQHGGAFLYVKVSTMQSSGLFAVHVKVTLDQGVLLLRNHPVSGLLGTTWQSRGGLGVLGRTSLSTAVRASVRDQVDQFINAYLAVNPR